MGPSGPSDPPLKPRRKSDPDPNPTVGENVGKPKLEHVPVYIIEYPTYRCMEKVYITF